MLERKVVSTPIEQNHKLWEKATKSLDDPRQYQRLIGKLIYLTITRPDIASTISVLSQFMHNPSRKQMKATYRVFRYLKKKTQERFTLCL